MDNDTVVQLAQQKVAAISRELHAENDEPRRRELEDTLRILQRVISGLEDNGEIKVMMPIPVREINIQVELKVPEKEQS